MPKSCLKPTLATMLMVLAAGRAQAQSGDFAAGWSSLKSYDIEMSLPAGFHLGIAGRMTKGFGIAGDFGWNQKGAEIEGLASADITIMTFSGGPRVYFGSERATGFAHALLGVARGDLRVNILGGEATESDSKFLFQPGGGVDIGITEAFAVRLQLDYQWIQDADGSLRFVAAAVFRFGGT